MSIPTNRIDVESAGLLDRFGITRIPADHFRYKSWRYSSLADAVAQAQRDDRMASENPDRGFSDAV